MKIKSIFGTFIKAKYVISKLYQYKDGRKYIWGKFIILLFDSLISVIGIIIPGLIINELMVSLQSGEINISVLINYLVLLLIVPTLYRLLLIPVNNVFLKIRAELDIILVTDFEFFVSKMDYETLETPNLQEWRERVSDTVEGSFEVVDLIGNIITTFISLSITFSIITYLNPLLIILTIVMVFINYRMAKWMNVQRFGLRHEYSKHQRKDWSLTYMLRDFSYAKEIRLFQVADLLLDKIRKTRRDLAENTFKNYKNQNKVNIVFLITEVIQSVVVYIYLINNVLLGILPLGSMTIYLSASQRFSGAITSVVNAYMALSERSMDIQEWQDFLLIPNKVKDGTIIPIIDADSYIQFRNVSFQYPGSDIFTLKDINVKLSCMEKLCIVGVNGSGKSTFIKLLLRLYEPTSGEILLNGINIKQYDYGLYTKLFAPIFQDFATYEFTLKENVILAEKYDKEKFRKVCNNSNIEPLIKKLTKGEDTQIGKEIDPEGIEPSGGEGQRIAIARACYHGGEIFILDEPTAALDPNAEFEIYTQFNDMITDKGAILITHRLSAVQLANKVAVFDGGHIAEYGTHEELYAKGGIYTDMFDKQAKFYRDQEANEE